MKGLKWEFIGSVPPSGHILEAKKSFFLPLRSSLESWKTLRILPSFQIELLPSSFSSRPFQASLRLSF